MKIGIIVYSQTGNTYETARRLKERLEKDSRIVKLEQVTSIGKTPSNIAAIKFDNLPKVEPYDLIVFAAPVQAFTLALVMKAYLEQIQSLQGKKVACFVTKRLASKWTGGNNAVNTMAKICAAKGASIIGRGIVVWAGRKRQQSIATCLDSLTNIISKTPRA